MNSGDLENKVEYRRWNSFLIKLWTEIINGIKIYINKLG